MFSPDISLMLMQEKQKDMRRELAYRQLLQEAGLQHSTSINAPRHAVAWLGEQMVRLGAKLQSFDVPAPTDNLAIKKA